MVHEASDSLGSVRWGARYAGDRRDRLVSQWAGHPSSQDPAGLVAVGSAWCRRAGGGLGLADDGLGLAEDEAAVLTLPWIPLAAAGQLRPGTRRREPRRPPQVGHTRQGDPGGQPRFASVPVIGRADHSLLDHAHQVARGAGSGHLMNSVAGRMIGKRDRRRQDRSPRGSCAGSAAARSVAARSVGAGSAAARSAAARSAAAARLGTRRASTGRHGCAEGYGSVEGASVTFEEPGTEVGATTGMMTC